MKHLALGIGLSTCTFFAAENNSRMVKFENRSGHNLEAFYCNPRGIQSHLDFSNGFTHSKPIAENHQDIIVTWEKFNVQHKLSLKNAEPTIAVLPAVALKITGQKREISTFLAPEISHTYELDAKDLQ